jgi:hypothetical protein
MAKRKNKTMYRTKYIKSKSRRKSTSSGNGGIMALIGGAMIYGAFREKASDAIQPLTSKIPLGNIADEVVLGAAGYFAAKKGTGIVKEIGKAALTIEAARIGEAVVNGQLNLSGNSQSSNSTNSSTYMYG